MNFVFFSSKLIHLSKQVQNRYPIATCGLFVFDWTVLFTVRNLAENLKTPNPNQCSVLHLQMIAAATTYLTIFLTLEPSLWIK